MIIYATGYDREKHPAWQILPESLREIVGRIYGYGSGVRGDPGPWDGELRNLWKPTHQRSLWFTSEASYNLAFTPRYWRYRSKRVKPAFKHPFTKFRKR